MYGKLFSSMYDGTLVADWRALITFQQMIVLCDKNGVIDVTPEALRARTGIPIEHILAGIEVLERPDPRSRTPDENGVRIVRLDEHRDWGWRIVNHEHYKNLVNSTDKAEKNRERQKKFRDRQRSVTVTPRALRNVTDNASNALSRHTDTDTNTKKKTSKKESPRNAVTLPDRIPPDAWRDFLEHRRRLKKPMTDRAQVLAIGKLEKLCEAGDDPLAIIDQSIERGWSGLFALKTTEVSSGGAGDGRMPRTDREWQAIGKTWGIDPKVGESWESYHGRLRSEYTRRQDGKGQT